MFLDLKKTIFARYLLSVCQCVIEDLDLDFYYFHGSVVRNNYFDLKNTCFCKSKRLHGFGEYYCEKNEELLIKYYSFHACRQSSKVCLHSDGLFCNSCFNYYKSFYLYDTIKICISSIHFRNKGRYRRYRNFNVIEAGRYFRISGEKKNGSEQMAFNFDALLKEILLQ